VNCYAERIAARFAGPRLVKSFPHDDTEAGPFSGFVQITNGHPQWTGRVELIESKLVEPLHWHQPRRIFVNSMSDLFHENLPDDAIDRVFAVMALCPQHTFQVLTKRAERMYQWSQLPRPHAYESNWWAWWRLKASKVGGPQAATQWPLPNVWLGVSAEDQQRADERIPWLLKTPAAVRFVSYEPALGPVDFEHLPSVSGIGRYLNGLNNSGCHGADVQAKLDWIIIGGESGPGARPFDLAWARSAIQQCREAGVPCFVKQLGAHPMALSTKRLAADTAKDWAAREKLEFLKWPDGTHFGNRTGIQEWNGYEALLNDPKGGDPAEWPEWPRVRQFPRSANAQNPVPEQSRGER
jgi:protein gp37